MDLPKFHETFIPILEILSNGKTIHYNKLGVRLAWPFTNSYMSTNPDVRKKIAKLRKDNKQKAKENFSFRDLRRSGLSKKEIGCIPSKTAGDVVYYDKLAVHHYLKYEKGIDIN